MKQLLFALATILCCTMLSCHNPNTNTTNSEATNNSQGEQNLAVLHNVYQGIETGDMTKLASIADDAVDHSGPDGKAMTGGDNIKKMLTDFHNHIKDLKLETLTEAANGEYTFSLVKMTGTVIDSFMGMPAGAAVNSTSVDVVKYKDGKATEHWGFMDPAEMMKMMPPHNMNNMDSKTMDATTPKK